MTTATQTITDSQDTTFQSKNIGKITSVLGSLIAVDAEGNKFTLSTGEPLRGGYTLMNKSGEVAVLALDNGQFIRLLTGKAILLDQQTYESNEQFVFNGVIDIQNNAEAELFDVNALAPAAAGGADDDGSSFTRVELDVAEGQVSGQEFETQGLSIQLLDLGFDDLLFDVQELEPNLVPEQDLDLDLDIDTDSKEVSAESLVVDEANLGRFSFSRPLEFTLNPDQDNPGSGIVSFDDQWAFTHRGGSLDLFFRTSSGDFGSSDVWLIQADITLYRVEEDGAWTEVYSYDGTKNIFHPIEFLEAGNYVYTISANKDEPLFALGSPQLGNGNLWQGEYAVSFNKTVEITEIPSGGEISSSRVSDYGSLEFSGIDVESVAFSETQTLTELSSKGIPITLQVSNNLITGAANGVTIFALQLNSDGSYEFSLLDVLDHTTPENDLEFILSFQLDVTDKSSERFQTNIDVVVNDDHPVENFRGYFFSTIDESELVFGEGEGTIESAHGSGLVDFGKDQSQSFAFDEDQPLLSVLTSQGSALYAGPIVEGYFDYGLGRFSKMQVFRESDDALVFEVAIPIIDFSVEAIVNNYFFTLHQPLDHDAGGNGKDSIMLDIAVTAVDGDGDEVSGFIRPEIVDDVPEILGSEQESNNYISDYPVWLNGPPSGPEAQLTGDEKVGSGSVDIDFGTDGAGEVTIADINATATNTSGEVLNINDFLDIKITSDQDSEEFTYDVFLNLWDAEVGSSGEVDISFNVEVMDADADLITLNDVTHNLDYSLMGYAVDPM